MPLVVPETSGAKDDLKSEWMQKLVGKKLTESTTDHQVCLLILAKMRLLVLSHPSNAIDALTSRNAVCDC